jgi:uncharacterized metal-binding protein YceD (DUF177 family)
MTRTTPHFAEKVVVEHIPPEGRHIEIDASAQELEAIAKRLGVPAINRLSGVFDLRKTARGVNLEGRLDARLTRECVASLEIFDEHVADAFTIVFQRDVASAPGAEIEISEDSPEPLEGEVIDLVEILIQQLSLAMDPYPRKPGAASLAENYALPEPDSPFRGLKAAIAKQRDQE